MMMMMMSRVRIDPKEKRNVMYESAEESSEVRRGPWTLEEDNLLIHYITSHGEGRWNSLAKFAGLRRTGKSCRLRWLNYLKPDIKRGNLTPHEQLSILELHSKWGNRWSKIAQHLPGRTDNEIKNYWRTRVQKQARQLKVDSNSKKFVEAIRRFWMPRLMEKMEQNSSSSTTTTSFETHENYNIMITNPPSPLSDHVPPPPPTAAAGDSFMPHLEPPPEPTKPVQCENPLIDENSYYHVGFPSYDMQELVAQDISLPECHVAGVDWFGDDLGSSTFWNTDELWQFRKSEEVGRVLL